MLACDDLTGMLQQHLQEEKGLFLKFYLNTLSSQLPGTLVNLKEPETNQARPGSTGCVQHASTPLRTEFTTTAKRQEQDRCALLIAPRKGAIVDALTVKWTEKERGSYEDDQPKDAHFIVLRDFYCIRHDCHAHGECKLLL